MSVANPLWGAPRVHGELLKLGIDVGQTTVAKYMARRRQPPSQGGKIFLRNHADGIASMDLFVVPTISFRLLYGLLILQHSRRQLLWLPKLELRVLRRIVVVLCPRGEDEVGERDGEYRHAEEESVGDPLHLFFGLSLILRKRRSIRE